MALSAVWKPTLRCCCGLAGGKGRHADSARGGKADRHPQIERLKDVRGATSADAVKDCFIMPEPETYEALPPASGVEYKSSADHNPAASTGSIDRLMAKAGMMSVGGDDDVD